MNDCFARHQWIAAETWGRSPWTVANQWTVANRWTVANWWMAKEFRLTLDAEQEADLKSELSELACSLPARPRTAAAPAIRPL